MADDDLTRVLPDLIEQMDRYEDALQGNVQAQDFLNIAGALLNVFAQPGMTPELSAWRAGNLLHDSGHRGGEVVGTLIQLRVLEEHPELLHEAVTWLRQRLLESVEESS